MPDSPRIERSFGGNIDVVLDVVGMPDEQKPAFLAAATEQLNRQLRTDPVLADLIGTGRIHAVSMGCAVAPEQVSFAEHPTMSNVVEDPAPRVNLSTIMPSMWSDEVVVSRINLDEVRHRRYGLNDRSFRHAEEPIFEREP